MEIKFYVPFYFAPQSALYFRPTEETVNAEMVCSLKTVDDDWFEETIYEPLRKEYEGENVEELIEIIENMSLEELVENYFYHDEDCILFDYIDGEDILVYKIQCTFDPDEIVEKED